MKLRIVEAIHYLSAVYGWRCTCKNNILKVDISLENIKDWKYTNPINDLCPKIEDFVFSRIPIEDEDIIEGTIIENSIYKYIALFSLKIDY